MKSIGRYSLTLAALGLLNSSLAAQAPLDEKAIPLPSGPTTAAVGPNNAPTTGTLAISSGSNFPIPTLTAQPPKDAVQPPKDAVQPPKDAVQPPKDGEPPVKETVTPPLNLTPPGTVAPLVPGAFAPTAGGPDACKDRVGIVSRFSLPEISGYGCHLWPAARRRHARCPPRLAPRESCTKLRPRLPLRWRLCACRIAPALRLRLCGGNPIAFVPASPDRAAGCRYPVHGDPARHRQRGCGQSGGQRQFEHPIAYLDLAYKHLLCGEAGRYSVNWLAGLRYAYMRQNFKGDFSILGTTTVDSNITFDGIGPRFGLDGELLGKWGLRLYGRTTANLLAGHFGAQMNQFNVFAGNQGNIDYKSDRIVPVLEAELGVGWVSPNGRFRVTTSYYLSAWYNSVTTPDFINAVQNNNFTTTGGNLQSTQTFDGLTFRVEFRF